MANFLVTQNQRFAEETAKLRFCALQAGFGLLTALMLLLPTTSWAAPLIEARDVQVLIPGADFLTPAAKLTVEKVCKEERRVGFFRVKLLVVQVAQGVRLELYQGGLNTNWQAGFRFKPGLTAKANEIEWRDVSICLAPETAPRLQAQRLEPPTAGHPEVCLLEGVTLQSDSGPIKAARAKLLLQGEPGRVVFEIGGKIVEWDLLSNHRILEQPINQTRNHS